MSNARRGRPSKGPREPLITRAPVPIAEAGKERAEALGFSVSDYLTWLIAQDTQLSNLAPRPADTTTRQELPIPAA